MKFNFTSLTILIALFVGGKPSIAQGKRPPNTQSTSAAGAPASSPTTPPAASGSGSTAHVGPQGEGAYGQKKPDVVPPPQSPATYDGTAGTFGTDSGPSGYGGHQR